MIPSLNLIKADDLACASPKLTQHLPADCPVLDSGCMLINQLQESVLLIQPRTLRIMAANPAMRLLTGYEHDELMRMTIPQLVVDTEAEIYARRDHLIRFQQPMWIESGKLRHKSGQAIDVDRTISLIQLNGYQLIWMVARDITLRLVAEAELRQAQKMEAIGKLAGNIAHDFNNWLTVILGQTELLQSMLGENEKAQSKLHQIHAAGEKAAHLTKQLLSYGRRQPLAIKNCDATQELISVVALAKELVGKDIQFIANLPEDSCRVVMDAGGFSQAIMNLIINARDAMPSGGRLEISLRRQQTIVPMRGVEQPIPPGRYVTVSVTDTGIGMTPEMIPKIFEPFYSTKGKLGTGLGLANVYGFVKQIRGHIRVESRPHQGANFELYLPEIQTADGVPEDA